MNVNALLSLVFLFLVIAVAAFLGWNPIKMVKSIELKRADPQEKQRQIWLRDAGLSKKDLFLLRLHTTLKAAQISDTKFYLMTTGAMLVGIIGGGLLFGSWLVGVFAGLTCAVFPYILLTVRVQKLERLQEDQLGNIMQTITNAYVSSNDLIKAVETYVADRNRRSGKPIVDPFAEFLAEAKLVNADLRRALLILESKIDNQYFHDWIKMLILCSADGEMKFALYPILASMNDKKALQEESDNAMKKIWINFLTVVGLSFSIPLMLKLLNEDWYDVMVNTPIGKLILIVMFIYAIVAAFLVLRINKPLYR